MDASVTGSVGPVCTSRLCSSRPTPKAPANPMRQTDRELYQPAPQNQLPHLLRLRAERHAHADFLRPLRDGIGGHGIQADRRQDDGDAGKDREHRAEHTHIPALLREVLIHRADVGQRHVGIEREDLLAKLRRERARIGTAAHEDGPRRAARSDSAGAGRTRPGRDPDSCMPPRCRTFGARPTIVAQADCFPAGVSSVRRIRLPIGSSLPKYVVASCWLMMATSCPGVAIMSGRTAGRAARLTPSASK